MYRCSLTDLNAIIIFYYIHTDYSDCIAKMSQCTKSNKAHPHLLCEVCCLQTEYLPHFTTTTTKHHLHGSLGCKNCCKNANGLTYLLTCQQTLLTSFYCHNQYRLSITSQSNYTLLAKNYVWKYHLLHFPNGGCLGTQVRLWSVPWKRQLNILDFRVYWYRVLILQINHFI